MSDIADLQPPIQYAGYYVVYGVLLVVLAVAVVFTVFFLTRRKPQRNLSTLKPKPYIPPNVDAIKQKYLALIAETETQQANGMVASRVAYQSLSKLVRLFIYEVNGNRVDTFTLDQLRRSRYPEVTKAVEEYYPPSFQRMSATAGPEAFELARGVIAAWN